MEHRRVGGGILAGVGVVGGTVISMAHIEISREFADPILAICAVAFFIGLLLANWRENRGGEMGNDQGDGERPTGPRAGTAVYIGPGASHTSFHGGKITGRTVGLEDHGKSTKVVGTDISAGLPDRAEEKPKRKIFSGWSPPEKKD